MPHDGAASRVATLKSSKQLMCHLHIQKTGGTSLAHWLIDSFCADCDFDWGGYSKFYKLSPCKCPHLDAHGTRTRTRGSLEHRGFRTTSKHCAAVASSAGWSSAAIVSIREPVSRTLSQWRHCANEFDRDGSLTECSHARLRRPTSSHSSGLRGAATFSDFWHLNRETLTNFQTRWLSDTWARPPNVTLALDRLSAAWLVSPTDQLDGLKTCILRHANGSHARHSSGRSTAEQRARWASALKAQSESAARLIRPLRNGTALVHSITAATRLDRQLYMRAAAIFSRRCHS